VNETLFRHKKVDLLDRGFVQKPRRTEWFYVWKNPRLSLRSRQAILHKKDLNILCDTIRRHLLAHEEKFRSTVKKSVQKIRRKKIYLSERKFRPRLAQGNFLRKIIKHHGLYHIVCVYFFFNVLFRIVLEFRRTRSSQTDCIKKEISLYSAY